MPAPGSHEPPDRLGEATPSSGPFSRLERTALDQPPEIATSWPLIAPSRYFFVWTFT
jgi:hypothetical protein